MASARQIRSTFIEYFKKNGHEIVRSSALVPQGDPTLLFTNAGMVQFKDVFTGRETRDYKRATSSQKCIRAGGKHNDLENVGRTARHHTFFEMLGNFSFGDYFKADAIRFAWELLEQYGIDKKRLMFTVFGGDKTLGIEADDEARALWRKVTGVGDDKVLGLGLKDNFWMMGDTGPQGPCSEIHYHQGDHLPCPERQCLGPACDCDRWLEIWNLVFMQYEKKTAGGPLERLPAPSIDTGMGLERLTAVIQGLMTNYDTDLLRPYITRAEALSKKSYGKDAEDDVSMRVIADHARASAFLIADGVFPDKAQREYVLRRIFRRAVRHGKRLGIDEPFMHIVCGDVVDQMGADFPELTERRPTIERVTLEEETRFRQTLDRGLKLLDEEIAGLGGGKQIPGGVVFKLYDTFGFPTDLTAIIAGERGLTIDQAGFDAAMAKQQAQGEFAGQDAAVNDIYKALPQELGKTEFLGYQGRGEQGAGDIQLILVGGARVKSAGAGAKVEVVTKATPFYGESGGQIGDTGMLETETARVRIEDTQKPAGDVIIHRGVVDSGMLQTGQRATLMVDGDRRDRVRANHSATHLLHHALRKVLGDHVTQKGSLVAPDKLRFDFSHFAPMTEDEKRTVEELVNEEIRANEDSRVEVMAFDDARKVGAMALFGEKYGDKVRVMRIGRQSVELCGGTHVRRAGDIGLFKITSETGVAQGVRRIEAVTGAGALEHVRRLEAELGKAGAALKAGPFEVADRVLKLGKELKEREREIEALRGKLASGGARDLMADVREVAGVKLLVTRTDVADPKALREVGDKLRERIGSGVIVIGGADLAGGKVALLALVTADLVGRFHAGKIVGEVAKAVGGKGGGRPDLAQAGGTQPENLDSALALVPGLLA